MKSILEALDELAEGIDERRIESRKANQRKYGRGVLEDDAREGAAFNAYFASKVCDAVYFLYREGFLAAKWGEDWIEATVAPAEDLELGYEEADEEIPPDRTPPREAD